MLRLIKIIGDFFISLHKRISNSREMKSKKLKPRRVRVRIAKKQVPQVSKVHKPTEMNSKYIWLLDPGHGGMRDGVYQTEGKRSPVWSDGSQYFEGKGNREIVNKMIKVLRGLGIDARDIVNSEKDISRGTRVKRANTIYLKEGKRVIYVSIHSDAWKTEDAHGYSIYTSRGPTKSDKIAEVFIENMEEEFPDMKLRKDPRDGDKDKEANFTVIKNTFCPAILIENFFMTNPEESKLLLSEEGQDRIVSSHVNSIIEIEGSNIKYT